MCGIVGLFLKNEALRTRLGSLFAPMLVEMSGRGPDSAGFAVFREDAGGRAKASVFDPDGAMDWPALIADLRTAIDGAADFQHLATHTLIEAACAPAELRQALDRLAPALRIMSTGGSLEIYKEIGAPADVVDRFAVAQMTGSHMIGHTRMATESAVTTEGAHPFNTGEDLCLVHNGSLSNHHALRRRLERDGGITFQTENDSEVAAGYFAHHLAAGATLGEALEAGLSDLDGFYTFAVGTRDGFAVLRDPIACKPAVLAECDDWVAMASEFRALANLPGVDNARVWEPKPGVVYHWTQA